LPVPQNVDPAIHLADQVAFFEVVEDPPELVLRQVRVSRMVKMAEIRFAKIAKAGKGFSQIVGVKFGPADAITSLIIS